MTFNSLTYFLFLPLVYLVFTFTADRYRWLVLLTASYAFYASFRAPQLLLVLGLVTAISYVCGKMMGGTSEEAARKRIFWLGTTACISLLAVMKYLPPLFKGVGPDSPYAALLLSIGVSYFTLQAVSYLADIYLEIQEPEQHSGYHALALAFFPKLLQGPIERAGSLLPQLKRPYSFDYETARSGLVLFAWGMFKKVVVADRFALYANTVFNDVHSYQGISLLIGVVAYSMQIYFDFSGYTDMALGTARLFRIELTQNFNAPYLATSVADFWRRWHISFSRWILDYIFKPLQMQWRNGGKAGTAAALLITFLVSGIWHGASWGFVIWGGLHGIYLAVSVFYKPYQKRLHKTLGIEKSRFLAVWQVSVTYLLVSFAWIFFRSNTLDDAFYIVTHIFPTHISEISAGTDAKNYIKEYVLLGLGRYDAAISLLACSLLLTVNYFKDKVAIFECNFIVRWSLYVGLALSIIFIGVYKGDSFVYFKF